MAKKEAAFRPLPDDHEIIASVDGLINRSQIEDALLQTARLYLVNLRAAEIGSAAYTQCLAALSKTLLDIKKSQTTGDADAKQRELMKWMEETNNDDEPTNSHKK